MLAVAMDATGEILKSGALTNLTDLVKRLAGPASDEIGAIFADTVRVYRIKNLLRTAEKTKKILEAAKLEAHAVPSRLLLPLLDTCSIEDDDDLQARWAGLLASASQDSDSVAPSFIETLKQLTPNEAKHLDQLTIEFSKMHKRQLTRYDGIPYGAFTDAWKAPRGALETYERLGLVGREFDVNLKTPARSGYPTTEDLGSMLGELEGALDAMDAEVRFQYMFTDYALRFIAACRGPLSKSTAGAAGCQYRAAGTSAGK